jgi:hypothetical protein
MSKPKDKCDQYKCKNEGYKVVEIAWQPPTFCKDCYIKYLEDRLKSSEAWLERATRKTK